MNYFELFDMPLDLFPDEKKLKINYYKLSKRYHPDINQSSDPASHMEVLEKSGEVNAGYKVLSQLNLRLKYILELLSVEMNANEELPPEFLMEMMDLNEVVMEAAGDDEKRQKALDELSARDAQIVDKLRTVWNETNARQMDEEQLKKLKSLYYQQKYLLRIRKNLNRSQN
mgnify:CR=1 FL=1